MWFCNFFDVLIEELHKREIAMNQKSFFLNHIKTT